MRPEAIEFAEIPVKAFVRYVEQYPYHWHDALEIVLVLKGSVNISLGNEDLLLHENDLAVINMGEIHRFSRSEQDNKILFIQIESSFYRNLLPDYGYLFIYCCSAYHKAEAPGKYEELKEHIARLVWSLNEQFHEGRIKDIENNLTTLLSYITYNFDMLRWGFGTVAFDKKQVERLKQIAEQINNDDTFSLGLRDLAKEVNISLHYLSHDIKNKFGYTFQELLYYSRIEYAAKLLLSTDERIVDIAMACGFSDPKYLIKHFKKNFQSTPSQFRKMYRADAKTLASQVQYRDYPLAEALKYLERDQRQRDNTGK